MLGDLLVMGERTQLGQVKVDWVFHEPVDPQSVAGEVVGTELLELIGRGVLAVVPEVRRDVLLGVLARLGVQVFEQPLGRSDQKVTGLLHLAREAIGERGRRHPGDDHDDERDGEDRESDPGLVVAAGVHVVEVPQRTGREHQGDVNDDEDHEPAQDGEVE